MIIRKHGHKNLPDLANVPSDTNLELAQKLGYAGMRLAGWLDTEFNTDWPNSGLENGREKYEITSGGNLYRIYWTGSQWVNMFDPGDTDIRLFYSDDDVLTPDKVTTWVIDNATGPTVGTVAPYVELGDVDPSERLAWMARELVDDAVTGATELDAKTSFEKTLTLTGDATLTFANLESWHNQNRLHVDNSGEHTLTMGWITTDDLTLGEIPLGAVEFDIHVSILADGRHKTVIGNDWEVEA